MTHDPMYTDGGAALFRCFQPDPPNGYLQALVRSSYRWEPGRQEADAIPTADNYSGLWGFKTYPEAIYQEGERDDLVYALTKHFGKTVEHQTGLRSQYAEIVAFIEPVRPKALREFPREYLGRLYPEVPVIEQHQIRKTIEELGLFTLPRAIPFPLMQWSGPNGELIWAPEGEGPSASLPDADKYEMLPAAATYPHETHPEDLRLRKSTFRDSVGDTYVFWKLVGGASEPTSEARSWLTQTEALSLVQIAPEDMYRHRLNREESKTDG